MEDDTEDVVTKECSKEVFVEECLLQVDIDTEILGIVTKAIVVAGRIMQIENCLRGLVDGKTCCGSLFQTRIC